MTTILAGDIGGTKTLLATYRVNGDELIEQRRERYSSAEWHDFSVLLNHFLEPLSDRPQRACLAIAGPVQGGRVQLTNLPWMLEEHALQNACAIEHLELVNDFAVLIYGLNHLQAHQQHTLVAKPAISGAPIAILGAGTGLGVAMGIPGPRGLMAMASEAAHGEFAARTDAEWQLKQWLLQDQGLERVSIERVVSGPGLGQVFRWCLSQHTGSTPHPLHQPSQLWATSTAAAPDRPDLPALVAAAAQSGDPLAQHALSIWLGAYGSVAGDLVLQSLCLGGLWIGGGTAGKLLDQLATEAFLGPFAHKGRLSAVVNQVPVKALTEAGAGLFSAACRARMLLGL